MNTPMKVKFILDLAKEGKFGTPENPLRGSSGRCNFWDVYNELRTPVYYAGTLGYVYAQAGSQYRHYIKYGEDVK